MNEINAKFRKVYKVLKENMLITTDQNNNFIQSTQILSFPLFYQILFFFSIIKTVLLMIYFCFFEGECFNFSMSLILIQLMTAFLLTQQQAIIKIKNNKNLKIIKVNESLLEQVFKIVFIVCFCVEENLTIYYYNHLLNLNPGFIFFILLLILSFDQKTMLKFNELLFYLYIGNLVLLLYFLSLKNLMNFFLPINLVITMFILLNIISQNFNKRLMKMQLYHKFFENLLFAIFKVNEMYLIHERKILFSDSETNDNAENTSTVENYLSTNYDHNEDILGDMTDRSISEYSIIEKGQYPDIKKTSIGDFKGFDLVYKNHNYNANFVYFNKNLIVNFLNLLFYLKNSNSNLNNDKIYINELESIYANSKHIIKNSKLKNLVEENSFRIREKITTLMLSFMIESVCNNQSIKCEDFLNEVNFYKNKFEVIISSICLGTKEYKSLINIFEDLSHCVKFDVFASNDKIVIDYDVNNDKKDFIKLSQRKEEEYDLNHLESMISSEYKGK
jgi:hypothetical protein